MNLLVIKEYTQNNKDEGHISYINGLDEIEHLNKDSQIILCARTNNLLRPYAEFLKQNNLIWLRKITKHGLTGVNLKVLFPTVVKKL